MHKSKGRWRGRTGRTRVGKQEEKERKETRTNTLKSDWNIRGSNAPRQGHPGGGSPGLELRGRDSPGQEQPGLQKEEEAAAATSGEENMNRSKERWRERIRRTRIGKREEKEKTEKRKSTLKPDWNIQGRSAHGLEHPGGGGPGLEHPGKKRPRIGVSWAAKGGGSNGGKKRQGEHER